MKFKIAETNEGKFIPMVSFGFLQKYKGISKLFICFSLDEFILKHCLFDTLEEAKSICEKFKAESQKKELSIVKETKLKL